MRSCSWIQACPGRSRAVRLALLAVAGFAFARSAPAADRLTPAERQWLAQNEPIVFVSQSVYPPFEFADSEGASRGMCIDLAKWIARELGFRAEFRHMSFHEAQNAVLDGRADVLTSLFYSKKRDRQFDFTPRTWEVPALIFVRTERPDITGLADLAGKRIAMQRGDFSVDYLGARETGFEQILTDSFAEAADRVIAGEADALIGDQPIVLHHLYARGLTDELKSVGTPLYVGRNGMAVREGRRELLAVLNKGIDLACEQGAFLRITGDWLGTRYEPDRSFWRNPYAIAAAAGLFAALAIALLLLAWGLHLRRIVARRTEELREARDPQKPVAVSHPWRLLAVRSLVLLVLLVPLGLAADRILRQAVVLPGYVALEQAEARRKLSAAMDGVGREARHLGQLAGDWAYWDDTYRFVQEPYPAYREANLVWPNLSDQSQIDLLFLFDLQGHPVFQFAFNPFEKIPVDLDGLIPDPVGPGHPLLQHPDPTRPRTGLLRTDIGPMLVASCAILPSDQDGPSRGTLVMGRFLRPGILTDLGSSLGAAVHSVDAHSSGLREFEQRLFDQLEPGGFLTEELNAQTLAGYAMLEDVTGRPALLLTLEFPRDILRQGHETSRLISLILAEFILLIFAGTAIWFTFSFRETFRRQEHIEALVQTRTAALQKSQEQWKHYVASAPIGIFIADADGLLLEVNPAVGRITGGPEEHLAGRSLYELFSPEWAEVGRAHVRQVMEKGRAVGEFGLRRPSGEPCWASISSVRLDEHRLLGFCEDITERRRAEETMRENTARREREATVIARVGASVYLAEGALREFSAELTEAAGRALDVARTGVWLFDENGSALTNLDSYVTETGTHESGAILRESECRCEFEALAAAHCVDAHDALNDPRTAGYADAYLKPLGITSLLDVAIRTEGRTVGALCFEHKGPPRTWRDDEITFAAQLADQLALALSHRNRRQAEEERESLQAQLNQAQKMESIGRLAGGVAHDFNNMLGVILGFTELGLDSVSPGEPLHAGLIEIRKAAERSADLTRQLLAFARKQTVVPKVLDLNQTVEGMLNMLRRIIGEHIDLDWKPGKGLGPVRIDPSQLDQILVNLCVNARDAIGDVGRVSIETAPAVFDEDYCARHPGVVLGDYVKLAIRDSGCGMDPETVAHIFEPFFSTKREGEGIGLGLATVYGIVRQNNGQITVHSVPGAGTVFTLFLPRHAESAETGLPPGAESPPPAGRETVLVAEDESAHLNMTCTMLRRQGYTVLAAGTPGEALRLAREHPDPIDLLLTDVIMPEMNGRDLARKLEELRPGIRRVFMSGYTADVIAHHGVLSPDVLFIQKPFTMKGLADKLRDALRRRPD